jgi:transposase-like protein
VAGVKRNQKFGDGKICAGRWAREELMRKGLEPNYFAVKQVVFEQRSTDEVAKDFGVSPLTVRAWIRDVQQRMPRNRFGQTPLDELAVLQAKIKCLLAERTALLARMCEQREPLEAEIDRISIPHN